MKADRLYLRKLSPVLDFSRRAISKNTSMRMTVTKTVNPAIKKPSVEGANAIPAVNRRLS